MAEFKSDLLARAKALCKKEDVAPDMAILLIGEEIENTVTIDDLLIALSAVVDSVQSAIVVERQSHCQPPYVALLVELDTKALQVMTRDQTVHLKIQGELKSIHLALLSSTGAPTRRVTLAEARRRMRSADPAPSQPPESPKHRFASFAQPGVSQEQRLTSPYEHQQAGHFLPLNIPATYRKLRPFSGSPSAKDEDSFDIWVDQAEGQLEEWGAASIGEVEKRRRISEALRPPASSIVRDLHVYNAQATAQEYISALDAAFGTTESGEEILLKFHDTTQQEHEKPSDFLMRVNAVLRRAIRKGGADPGRADYLRLQKFIRSVYDEMLLVSLRLRDCLPNPPSFINLLSQVRRYEEEVAHKRSRRPLKGRSLQTMASSNGDSLTHPDLEDRMAKLEAQLSSRHDPPPPLMDFTSLQAVSSNNMYPSQMPSPRFFCYKCGEDGHIRRSCQNPPNLTLVNQKLIQCVQTQGNGGGRPRRSDQGPVSKPAPTQK